MSFCTNISQISVNNGLVSFFGFDGNAQDSVSNYSGTIKFGARGAQDRQGNENGALEFDGIDDYIDLPYNNFAVLDFTNQLSLSMWVFPIQYSIVLIENRVDTDTMENGWHWQVNSQGKMVFMSHNYRSDELNEYYWLIERKARCRVVCSNTINLRQWTHIAVTKKDKNVSFFINGQFINTAQLKEADIAYSPIGHDLRQIGRAKERAFYEGDYSFGVKRYANARFDELRVYNRQISSSEINQIYNYQPPQSCALTIPGTQICKSCRADRNLLNENCVCKEGTWDNGTSPSCQLCPQYCSKCQNLSTCEKCKSETRSGNSCECIAGFYDNGVDTECQQCVYPCQHCRSETECISCQNDENRVDSTSCQCIPGFNDFRGKCQEGICDFRCRSCNSNGVCDECMNDLREIGNNCLCKNGYYEIDSMVECFQCEYPCQECESAYKCTSCQFPENRVDSVFCECLEGYKEDENKICQLSSCELGYHIEDSTCKKIECQSNLCGVCNQNQYCFQLREGAIGFLHEGIAYNCLPYCDSCINDKACISINAVKYEEYLKQNQNKDKPQSQDNTEQDGNTLLYVILPISIALIIFFGFCFLGYIIYNKMRQQNKVLDLKLEQIHMKKNNEQINSSNSKLNLTNQQLMSQEMNFENQYRMETPQQDQSFNSLNYSKNLHMGTPKFRKKNRVLTYSDINSLNNSGILQQQLTNPPIFYNTNGKTQQQQLQIINDLDDDEFLQQRSLQSSSGNSQDNMGSQVDLINQQKKITNRQNEIQKQMISESIIEQSNIIQNNINNNRKGLEQEESQDQKTTDNLDNQKDQKLNLNANLEDQIQNIQTQIQQKEQVKQRQQIQNENDNDNDNDEKSIQNILEQRKFRKKRIQKEKLRKKLQVEQSAKIEQEEIESDSCDQNEQNYVEFNGVFDGYKGINLDNIQWDKLISLIQQYGLSKESMEERLRDQSLPSELIQVILDIGLEKSAKKETYQVEDF